MKLEILNKHKGTEVHLYHTKDMIKVQIVHYHRYKYEVRDEILAGLDNDSYVGWHIAPVDKKDYYKEIEPYMEIRLYNIPKLLPQEYWSTFYSRDKETETILMLKIDMKQEYETLLP